MYRCLTNVDIYFGVDIELTFVNYKVDTVRGQDETIETLTLKPTTRDPGRPVRGD